MQKKVILLLSVVTLFFLCIVKTCSLLGIHNTRELTTDKHIEVVEEGREVLNNFNYNSFQGTDTGVSFFDGKYIYFNTSNYLLKYDIYDGTETPVTAGMPVKCMSDGGDFIYGVTTMEDSTGNLKDYLVKVPKDGGSTEIFYKTECNHITSVAYDGLYAYYTDESHCIYRMGEELEEWSYSDKSADFPYIIGIFGNMLYITDGTKISYINVLDGAWQTAYNGLCSVMQKPIISDGLIYMMSDFNQNEIICIDIETGNTEVIINKSFINAVAKAEKIDSFSVSGDILFMNCDGKLYRKYLEEDGTPRFYRNIESVQSSSFDGNAYYVENDKMVVLNIN